MRLRLTLFWYKPPLFSYANHAWKILVSIRTLFFWDRSNGCIKTRSTPASFLSITVKWPIDWSTDWLIDWLIDWLTDWLIDWLIDWWTDWLIDWLSEWQIDWLIDWKVNWLIDWLIDWSIDWSSNVICYEEKLRTLFQVHLDMRDWKFLLFFIESKMRELQPFNQKRSTYLSFCFSSKFW